MATFSNLCLSCRKPEGIFNIYEVHECEGIGEIDASATMLKECFSIEISSESGLNDICQICMLRLRDAYCLKREITKNTQEFQKHSYLELEYLDDTVELFDNYFEEYNVVKSKLEPETGCFQFDHVQKENKNILTGKAITGHNTQRNVSQISEMIDYEVEPNIPISKIHVRNNERVLVIDGTKDNKKANILKDEVIVSIDPVKKCDLPNTITPNENTANIKPKAILKKSSMFNTAKIQNEENVTKESQKRVRFIDLITTKTLKRKQDVNNPFKLKPSQTNCPVCSETFQTTKKLHGHMNSHYAKEMCDQCGQGFVRRRDLLRHMATHVMGHFACTICDQVFTKVNSRNSHVWRVHKTTTPYPCSECEKRFRTFHKRLRHLQEVHGQTEPKYPCPDCDKKFFYSGSRSQHIRTTHLHERRFKCSRCPMVFAKRREVLSHLANTHDIGDKKYQCHVCHKSFFRVSTLKYHLKRHDNTENKPYRCTICDARFAYKAVLKCHTMCHKNEAAAPPAAATSTGIVTEDEAMVT